MREILFRGIPKEKSDGYTFSKIWSDNCDGSFVYGSLLISKGKYYICASSIFKINCCINNAMMSVIEVIPESVGQYTGLTDKNGKKVFEGDIIQYADMYEYEIYLESLEHPENFTDCVFDNMWATDKVAYCIEHSYPAFDLNSHDFEVNGLCELKESMQYHYEVIGNIHDNPELLKGGAE